MNSRLKKRTFRLVIPVVLVLTFINRQFISDTMFGYQSIPCLGLTYNNSMLKMDTWSQVDSARHLFVFSAYYEMSSGVTIIGAKTSEKLNYLCQLWYQVNGSVTVKTSETNVLTHGENHDKRYSAINLNCIIPTVGNGIPYAVSVTLQDEPCQQPNRLIPVRKIVETTNFKRNFTVCVKPFYYNYGRAYELVEWMELTKLLGADYFVFYNYSTASNTKHLLDYYSKRGEAEVVQWAVPLNVDQLHPTTESEEAVDIHDHATIASINDCLFRVRYKSRFLVFVDLDEFIIPRLNNDITWYDMLKRMPDDMAAYIFKNVFFRKEWDNPQLKFLKKDIADKYRIVPLQKSEREDNTWEYGERSKYICRPNYIVGLGNHHIEKIAKFKQQHEVPENYGLLHHYRQWPIELGDAPRKRIVDLTLIDKYILKDKLIDSVVKVWSENQNLPLDIPPE